MLKRFGQTILIIVIVGGLWAWAQPHTVLGKTANEWYPDTLTADLAEAACKGQAGKVIELVDQGADVDAIGIDDGPSVLSWATMCENVSGVRALLAAGANPNLRLLRGNTAVGIAVHTPDPELLRLLLEHGGDPDIAPDNTHHHPLRYALSIGHQTNDWTKFDMMIEFGADINAPSINNATIAERALGISEYCKIHELLDLGYSNRPVELYHGATLRDNMIPGDKRDCRDALIERLEPLLEPGEYEAYLAELQARADRWDAERENRRTKR